MRGEERERGVVRLARSGKKGILRLVFSRLLIVAVLMAVQIMLYLSLLAWFEQYLPHYALLQALFVFGMAVYLFNSGMDSSAKLTWLALIAVAPLLGAALLAFTQSNLGHQATKQRTAELIAQSKDLIAQNQETLERLKGDSYAIGDLRNYLCRSGNFPIYDRTEVAYFPSGEEKFSAMLEELEKAKKFIFLEYFIIEEGYMWGRILDILSRKAKEGVLVRVLYDGMCELSLLPRDYPKRLAELGIQAKTFSPLTPFLSTHYNYRDHRKILVIDGTVAFNGGVNLADEYINRKERFGHWKDTAVMLRGDAVRSFTLMFLQMWNLTEAASDFPPKFLESACAQTAAGFVMPYCDNPLDGERVGESVYMDTLYRAKDYVHIMTPYLILDGELETALKYAAERGVDVKIILPGVPDKKLPYALAKSHYKSLLSAGVKLYEYAPGFVHAKVFVSDDIKAIVGTINLDYRSLYHHFECATYLYKTPCVADIERDFTDTLRKCAEVTPETIRNEKLFYKLTGSLMKAFAPLM